MSPRSLAQRFMAAVSPNSRASSTDSPAIGHAFGSPNSDVPQSPAVPITTVDEAVAAVFLPLFTPLLHLAILLPTGDDPLEPSPLLRGALNALLNFPLELPLPANGVPLWLGDAPGGAQPHYPELGALLSRLYVVLGWSLNGWFPVSMVPPNARSERTPAHPDDLVKLSARGDSSRAEEVLGPLLLLLRKVTMIAVIADEMRELLLPDDLERSLPLERRADLTGHLVRLMSSIVLPNTANCAGELLYNLCGRDPTTLATQIGYGNASGFLQNRGELVPPPPISVKGSSGTKASRSKGGRITPSTSDDEGETSSKGKGKERSDSPPRTVNPITGAYDDDSDAPADDGMTADEKEREAERLYTLFDRMMKTGVMDVKNPVQQAMEEGKLEDVGDEVDEEAEEREEGEALAELMRWKERKAKGTN